MSKIDELLDALNQNEQIKRANHLKQLILNHPEYLNRFERIKVLQKEIVRKEYSTGVLQIEAKKAYESELQELLESPIISEYLLLIEEINNLVQTLASQINDNLSIENVE